MLNGMYKCMQNALTRVLNKLQIIFGNGPLELLLNDLVALLLNHFFFRNIIISFLKIIGITSTTEVTCSNS